MEFLLTYGWAILAAIIAVAALSGFGVLNPKELSPSNIYVLPPFDGVAAISKSGVELELTLVGLRSVTIQEVSLDTLPSGVSCETYSTVTPITNGQTILIQLECTGLEQGSVLNSALTVLYTKPGSGIFQKSGGQITQPVTNEIHLCNDGLDNDGLGDVCDLDDTTEDNGNAGFHCSDGIDNDLDNLTDGNDPNCLSWDFPFGESLCSNTIDDDLDGWIDFDGAGVTHPDPGCDSFEDNDEFQNPINSCSDQIDNNNDGNIDGYDEGCVCDRGGPGLYDADEFGCQEVDIVLP